MSVLYATFLLVLFTDAVSKYWIQGHLQLITTSAATYPYGGIGVFKDFFGIEFSLVHAINKGAAWSIFSDHTTLLLYLRIGLIGLLLYYFYKQKSFFVRLPLALIIAGALGNVIDIFLYGHVIDMFHFIFWGYDYPVFNVADSFIFIGVVLYLIFSKKAAHDTSCASE